MTTHKYEYIWLDASGNVRSKVMFTTQRTPPRWNYDGSSTGQRETHASEVPLIPVYTVESPFEEDAKLVLCSSKYREEFLELFTSTDDLMPMFGFEQEFFLLNNQIANQEIDSLAQGKYYCGVATSPSYYREFLDLATRRCLWIGLPLTGYNFEVAPGQLEVQLCGTGIKACDQLLLMRYILARTAEEFGCNISYDPKPFPSLNGSGCHLNFSTIDMRSASTNEEFFALTNPILAKLQASHETVMEQEYYGVGNSRRLTGKCETSNSKTFTYGAGDRTASVRLPTDPIAENRLYFEDRRPAANIDPYQAAAVLLRAVRAEPVRRMRQTRRRRRPAGNYIG